jgi:hypothetical protein
MLSVRITPMRVFMSTCGIIYVWCLPLLALCGFSQPGSHSISAFIANPPATGAMAAVSFMPLTLMWEFQDSIIETHLEKNKIKKKLYRTLSIFQFFYGCFLTCTETYAPGWLHATTVVLFGSSFAYHGIMTINSIQSTNVYANSVLFVGILSFLSLLFVKGMWFWAMECLGFTSMLLYTPMQWYTFIEPHECNVKLTHHSLTNDE